MYFYYNNTGKEYDIIKYYKYTQKDRRLLCQEVRLGKIT